MTPLIRLHAILPRSRANGPGIRTVIWVQGCTLACPGCFNPLTHPRSSNWVEPVSDLVERLACSPAEIEGVTISGGEPLQQADALNALLQGIRSTTRLSVVLFSGFTRDEIERMPQGATILACTDVLIAGRYMREHHDGRGLRGSANQEVCFLSDRYVPQDLIRVPVSEVVVGRAGLVHFTGVRKLEITPGS